MQVQVLAVHCCNLSTATSTVRLQQSVLQALAEAALDNFLDP